MTYLVERLVELRRHLDHLEELRRRLGRLGPLRQFLEIVRTIETA